jgi:hypothetical protein
MKNVIKSQNVVADEIDTEEESTSLLDDIYDIAHDLFPDATENFKEGVCNRLERVANFFEDITPSWESACDRVYNKVMGFLDGAEEKTMDAIDKLQHSPVGKAIDEIYKKNHRSER